MRLTKLPWTSRDVGGTHFAVFGGPVLACFWLVLACFWPIFAHWGGLGAHLDVRHWPLFAALTGARVIYRKTRYRLTVINFEATLYEG